MLRIVICHKNEREAGVLFAIMKQLLAKVNINCEAFCYTKLETPMTNICENANYYDVVFAYHKDEECMEMVKTIRKSNISTSVVFIGDDETNVEELLCYRPTALIRDVKNPHQIAKAVKYACGEQIRGNNFFTVKNRDEIFKIRLDDIYYFESNQRIVAVYTKKNVIEFYAKLSEVLARLPQSKFARCHQSYIVNMDEVINISKLNKCIKISKGDTLPISKSCYSDIVTRFEQSDKDFD